MTHTPAPAIARNHAVAGTLLRLAFWALLMGFMTVWAAASARAQAAATGTELTDLTLQTGQRLTLPAGQWQVLNVYNSTSADATWTLTAVRNQDPSASVLMLLVREAAPTQRWTQPACLQESDNTFLVNGHDTRSNARLSKCSRLRIVGSNLAAFRTQADQLPGWPRALNLLPTGGPMESEDVLLAESIVLDQNGGGLRIEALLRADALGTSSSSLMVRERTGSLDQPFGVLSQWLTQLTEASEGAWLVSPAARPASLDALLGRAPGPGPGSAERSLQQALLDPTLPEVVNQRTWALPALLPDGELAYLSKGTGSNGSMELLLRQNTDLITPSEGDLLFAGQVDLWQTVLVVRHDTRLYSVLTSTLPLNLAAGIQAGTRVSEGQLLVRNRGTNRDTGSMRRQVGWQLVANADIATGVWAAGWERSAEAVRQLLRSPIIDAQKVLGMSALQLELGPDVSADTLAFRVNGQPMSVEDIRNAALLLPAGRHTVELISGRIFKSTVQREIDLRTAGTWVQFADMRGRDLGLFNAQFHPNDGRATEQARALLEQTPRSTTQLADAATAARPENPPQLPQAVIEAVPSVLPIAEAAAQPIDPPAQQAPVATPAAITAAAPLPSVTAVASVATPALTSNQSSTPPAQVQTQVQTQVQIQATTPVQSQAQIQAQLEVERLRAQLAELQAASAAGTATATNATPLRPLAPNPRRKALVMGNNAYEHVARLDNAQTDALAIADALKTVGFQVTLGRDLSERRMKELLRNFRQTVQGGDEVVVYFAGHGVQLANTNYLLPVDIRGQNEEEVKDESIPLQRVLDDMQERRAGFMLAIIDACRDNPFKTTTRAARSRGLAPTSAATGQMIIFSAGTGQQALDKLDSSDTDKNGLFTRLLLREIKKPGQPIDRIVRSVRTEVARLARTVGHEQTPAVYDQTLGDFYFIPVVANSRN